MNLDSSGISVSYGDIKVIDNAAHVFREGIISVILGPNGCGKTTLVKALVLKYAASGELSYIPQELYGSIGLTVEDVVALGLYDKSKFFENMGQKQKERIDDALKLFEIDDKRHRIYDTLSGGEKQRVMAARVICQDAPWIIMDEPASNLDVVHSEHILGIAGKLADQKGKSFIIVMHDINAAAVYGDEFVFMKDGSIIDVADKITPLLLEKTFGAKFGSVTLPSGRDVFYAL